MILRFLAACILLGSLAASARAEDLAWPVEPCSAAEIASASPAPLPSDSASLARVPFTLAPLSAGYIVSLDETNHAVIHCATGDSHPFLLYRGLEAVAGLVFTTPARPNNAIEGGRYLVRLYDTLGIGMVRAPPPAPILPACRREPGGPEPVKAPKPTRRINPQYPAAALDEGIEGEATIHVDVYASGAATPRCLAHSIPAGWFEQAAIEAVGRWRFDPLPDGTGARYYTVTVRFRLD